MVECTTRNGEFREHCDLLEIPTDLTISCSKGFRRI
ncbi:unnamed protein product [Haemonchus placei]|uniref:Uncharacterized protein n=1 Tax=Haemonchus placei TaxID=6290 RepID=A0A0N4X5T7_HAEPC|nr:unnamed protein product [Haemonchus placei]